MSFIDILGLTAAFLSSLSMAPQVIKICKTKETRDLSLGSFTVLAIGLFLWLVYGLLIQALPVIVGNAVGCSLVSYIVFMKIRHG